jgi:hypothetical protein
MEVSILIKLPNIEKCDGCPMITTDSTDILYCHIQDFSGATWVSHGNMYGEVNVQRPQSCIEKFGR